MNAYSITEEQNGLLFFKINREKKRNAVNYEVIEGLETAVEIAESSDIKAFIITGVGEKAFCSGGDLSEFHQLKTRDEAYPMLSRMANIVGKILLLSKPTIALMNGTATGGGCEIATACDFRLGRKGLKAGFVQGGLGITTGWGGGTILFEKFPSSVALKMLADSTIYSDEELLKMGFLNELYDGDSYESCLTFLNKLLEKDPSVLAAYKSILKRKWLESSILERIEKEVENCAILWGEELHHQKVDEFLKK
ncbi:enoyl-CoA hydratase/isomerase family protein [Bacillus sp. B15-48]|uniref:enoyl-CoA hydratase/isomerase family protein n=1 Tax=Bacillus sp. B15-48 TaxID=1548601 RepID=UPI00193FCCAF|nr:enoyl-CoA hydratase/isomerase family protein [Bacillus sp. B15-48]MBM4764043.1 enoyl-CoA hydratase/isomerase family protein [Bacillus sp. B15-48]